MIKKIIVMLSLSLMSSFANGLEIISQRATCIDRDSLMEITLEKYGANRIVAKLYDLDLNLKRGKMIYKTPRLTYNKRDAIYANKDHSIEVKLYRSKDKTYGAAIEIIEDRFFNDMFECASI